MNRAGEKGFGVTFAVLMITAAAIAGVPADRAATATDVRLESPVTGSTSSNGSTAQTTITGCTDITDPGNYVLTADVINSTADTCILISASNVVLDGDGHRVDGIEERRSSGVSIRHQSEDLENVTVRDLTLTDWRNGLESTGGAGIPEAISDIRVKGVTARSNVGSGIDIGGSPVRNVELVENHVRANGDDGIEVGGDAMNVDLIDNVAIGNVDNGINVFGDNATLRNNTVRSGTDPGIVDNSARGIRVNGDDYLLVGNNASANKGEGIRASSDSQRSNGTVIDNVVIANSKGGIETEGNGVDVINNTVRENGNKGIGIGTFGDPFQDGNGTVADNTVVRNGLEMNSPGIRLESDTRNYTVRNNTVVSNLNGIVTVGTDNTVVANDVSANRRQGIKVGPAGSGNTVVNNSVTANKVGIQVNSGENNTFRSNLVSANDETGILLYGAAVRNRVVDNDVVSNGEDGIRVDGTITPARNNNNSIVDTNVSANGANGIVLVLTVNNTIRDTVANHNGRDGIALRQGVRNTTVTGNNALANGRWAFAQGSFAGTTQPETNTVSTLRIAPNATVSFIGKEIGLKAGQAPDGSGGLRALDKYVNLSATDSDPSDSWANLSVYYTDSEVAEFNESSLRMFGWNGDRWAAVLGRNTVDTTRNVVSANVTDPSEASLVAISDRNPDLFAEPTSPMVIRTPSSFNLSVTGPAMSDVAIRLVSTEGDSVAPDDVTRRRRGFEASFSLTDPPVGFWQLNLTVPTGQRANVPVLVAPETPLVEAQSTWPTRLVPGRTTEMGATLRNLGTTEGVAIVAVDFAEAMETREILPGQDGEVISNSGGEVLIAQPVAANASASVNARFRLDPDQVIFPGQEPDENKTVRVGNQTGMGDVTLVGTLTPDEWKQISDREADEIRDEARSVTRDRLGGIVTDLNQSVNRNPLVVFPVNATMPETVVEYTSLLYRRSSAVGAPSPGSQRSHSSPHQAAATAERSPSVGQADGDEEETEIEVRVILDSLYVTDGVDAWEDGLSDGNGEPLITFLAVYEDQGGSDFSSGSIKAPEAPSNWVPGETVLKWQQCTPPSVFPVKLATEVIEREDSEGVGLEEVTLGTGIAAGVGALALGATGGAILGVVGVTMGVIRAGAYVNQADYFGKAGQTIAEEGLHQLDTGETEHPIPEKYRDRYSNIFGSLDREGSVKTFARVKTREIGKCGDTAVVQTSWDPNDITARPAGVGDAGYITLDETLRYRVRFENLENATAAAKDVTVTVPVDSALDFDSVETRATSHPDVVSVSKDPDTRTIEWTFSDIDLPPNETPPEGEGFVEFTAEIRDNATSGATIAENASIQFDFNPPIETNESIRTTDDEPPNTSVGELSSPQPVTFEVPWTGSDDTGGSGIETVTLWAAEDDGSQLRPVAETNGSSFTFQGEPGTTYRLATTAQDRVGNGEGMPETADVTITVEAGTSGPPPLPDQDDPPQDLNGDGLYRDITGDGEFTIGDVQVFFQHRDSDPVQNNPEAFNFDEKEPPAVSIGDVQALFSDFVEEDVTLFR